MHHIIGALLVGAVAGGVSGNRARMRPMVRGLVKGGIMAKRKVQAVGTTALSETKKLVEEARADLDHTGTEPRS